MGTITTGNVPKAIQGSDRVKAKPKAKPKRKAAKRRAAKKE